MNLNVYKLIVRSDLYKTNYTVRAQNITEASKIAKVKFAKSFKVFGNNVKISLDPSDLSNHINEICSKLYEGGNNSD